MPNNDDLINDILNELDSKKSSPPDEELSELLSASSETNNDYIPEEAPEYDVPEPEITAAEDVFRNDNQNYYHDEPEYPVAEEVYPENTPYQENEIYPDEYAYPAGNEYPPQRSAPRKKKKKKKKKRSRLPGVLILTTFIFAVSPLL